MNRNASLFENGVNLIPNHAAGYIKAGTNDRIYGVLTGDSGVSSLVFNQATDLAGAGAKTVKVHRVWYMIGVPSAANNWVLIESADGFDAVNKANIPALLGTESDEYAIVAEVLTQNLDGTNNFIAINCTTATMLLTSGSRYPQEVPLNPLA